MWHASRAAPVFAGLAYFALVFAAGFALGTVRVLWIAPAWGARAAELAEAPFMVAISFLVARLLVPRFHFATLRPRMVMGLVALALLLAAEVALVFPVRGMTLAAYLEHRDPVAAFAYYTALLLFAAFPSFVRQGRAPGASRSRHFQSGLSGSGPSNHGSPT